MQGRGQLWAPERTVYVTSGCTGPSPTPSPSRPSLKSSVIRAELIFTCFEEGKKVLMAAATSSTNDTGVLLERGDGGDQKGTLTYGSNGPKQGQGKLHQILQLVSVSLGNLFFNLLFLLQLASLALALPLRHISAFCCCCYLTK